MNKRTSKTCANNTHNIFQIERVLTAKKRNQNNL